MNETLLAASFSPTLGFVGWIIIGGLAGWIGSKIVNTDEQMSIVLNIVVGTAGGFLGGWLPILFGIDVASGGMFFSFLTRLFGAVILLWTVGLAQKRRQVKKNSATMHGAL